MRRSAGLLISLLALLPSNAAFANHVDGSVFLMPITTDFGSVGHAVFLNDLNQPAGATLTGTHEVTGPEVFTTSVQGDGAYSYTLAGPAEPGACYGTSLQVTATPSGSFSSYSGSWTGDTRCAPELAVDKDLENLDCETNTCPPHSPIVINVARGVYRFSSAAHGVPFDLDADGGRERVAWPYDVDEVGFLFLDRNGNGIPDSGRELFGDHTPLLDGQTAADGFEALAQLDSNHDGVISGSDAVWSRLALWRDLDRDGTGRASEIASLSSVSIGALYLDPQWVGRRDRYGNALRLQAHFTAGSAQARPYYDVYLTNIP